MSKTVSWSDREVFLLINYWGEEGIQEQLEGSKRNKHVYERLATELAKNGSNKTAEQCRAKMKKLKREYRKVRDKHNKTGEGRSAWRYFNALDRVLGDRPTSRPTAILNTSAPPINESDNEVLEDYDGDESTIKRSSPATPATDTPVAGDSEPQSSGSKEHSSMKGKRKRSREDKVEAVMASVVKEMVNAQKESDKLFMELEERRMKFEAEQKREEREFQLRWMSMLFAGQGCGPPPPFSSPQPDQYGPYKPFPATPFSPFHETQ